MAKRSVRVVVGGGVGGLTTAVALAQFGVEVGFDREAASSVGSHARSDGSCGTG